MTTAHPPKPRARERGFTLVEVMVAATTGLILMAAVGGVLLDSLRFADSISSRVALNRHAREIFELLAFGGANPNVNTATSTPPAPLDFAATFGIRGRGVNGTAGFQVPANGSVFMQRDQDNDTTRRYRFVLPPTGAREPGAPLPDTVTVAERIDPTDVVCEALNTPLEGCAAGLAIAGTQGFLRADPDLATTPPMLFIGFQVTDPRPRASARAYLGDQTLTWWTGFTLLHERAPQ